MTAPPGGCRFLEDEGLIVEQQGGTIEGHLAGCETCRESRRRIAAVEQALSSVPLPDTSTHWQQAVWSRLERAPASGGRRRWIALGSVAGLGTAAALLVIVAVRDGARPDAAPAPEAVLALSFESGSERLRSEAQHAQGDIVTFEGRALGALPAELRIYRDDGKLLVGCSTEPPCQRRADTLTARWIIPAPGRYRALLVAGPGPLPRAGAGYDQDTSALHGTPAVTVQSETIFEAW